MSIEDSITELVMIDPAARKTMHSEEDDPNEAIKDRVREYGRRQAESKYLHEASCRMIAAWEKQKSEMPFADLEDLPGPPILVRFARAFLADHPVSAAESKKAGAS